MKRERKPRAPQPPALRVIDGNPNAPAVASQEDADVDGSGTGPERRGVYFRRALSGGRRTLYAVDHNGQEVESYTFATCTDMEWVDVVIRRMRSHLDELDPEHLLRILNRRGS